MSAKNKLRIAAQLLKQTSKLATKESIEKLKKELIKLQHFLDEVQIQNDLDKNVEKMALTILHQVIVVSMEKMCQYYDCFFDDTNRIYTLEKINQIKHKTLQAKQLQVFLKEFLDSSDGELLKKININEFLRQNDIKIIEGKGDE